MDVGAGGDDQEVVIEHHARRKPHLFIVRVNDIDRLLDVFDGMRDIIAPGFDHVFFAVNAEGHEQVTRVDSSEPGFDPQW